MKTKKVLAILLVALGLIVWLVPKVEAVPMGTGWTYQGRLIDANSAADGEYDFEFKLFDDPFTGAQQGSAVVVGDLDVIDGYFTVELDFGIDVFAGGDARWLEIGLRSDSSGPFTTLSPRQEVTPTPYALYAKTAGGDNDWTISENDMYSSVSGNVGIGTMSPNDDLHVVNHIRIGGDSTYPTVYGELKHDGGGTGFRINANASGGWADMHLQTNGATRFFIESLGNVGIGTTMPASRLHVVGGCITGSLCSDIRLKKNIEPLPLGDSILDRVVGLQAVTFEWRHRDDGKRQIGLIAQDVEEVFPEVVTTPDDGTCEKGLLAIGLDAVLVEAIKELKVENELLKEQLKNQSQELNGRLSVLEKLIRQNQLAKVM